jgi:hypothetical protein
MAMMRKIPNESDRARKMVRLSFDHAVQVAG